MQGIITQGTTPTLSFTLPFEGIQTKSFFVTFRQGVKNVLEKNLNDCVIDSYTVSLTLSQKETLRFTPAQSLRMQVRMTDTQDHAFASPIFSLHVAPVLKGGDVI